MRIENETTEKTIREQVKEELKGSELPNEWLEDIGDNVTLQKAIDLTEKLARADESKKIVEMLKPFECKFCKVIHTITDDGKNLETIHKDFDLGKLFEGTEKEDKLVMGNVDASSDESIDSEMPEKEKVNEE